MILLLFLLTYFLSFFFFFNDTATTEIYTLSLHDALPISAPVGGRRTARASTRRDRKCCSNARAPSPRPRERTGRTSGRSEEHTSELQSQSNIVCRLLLEKKKIMNNTRYNITRNEI